MNTAATNQPAGAIPFPVARAAVWMLGVMLLGVLAILAITQGVFMYTLDDAYIHLSLARELRVGHYGLNPGEIAAPSSSLLWPWLLALTPIPGDGIRFAPMVWNAAAAVVLCLVVADAFRGIRLGSYAWAAVCVCLLLCGNFIALTFNGMEHLLQIVAAAAALAVLRRGRDGEPMPWWLLALVATGPLLRYESLALCVPVGAYLLIHRPDLRGRVLATALPVMALLAAFSLWLHQQGLGWLPTSVIARLPTGSGAEGWIDGFWTRIQYALTYPPGHGLLVLCGVTMVMAAGAGSRRHWQAHAAVATIVILHFLFGSFGYNLGRHESYAVFSCVLWILMNALPLLEGAPAPRFRAVMLAAVCAPFVLTPLFVYNAIWTPTAARNIHDQQYQMGRFARDYWTAPVGINDLGLVAWSAKGYVLDPFGLGSVAALDARRSSDTPEWMDRLAHEHDVDLVMVYDKFFPLGMPANWIKVGELRVRGSVIVLGSTIVSFYATRPQAVSTIRDSLMRFGPTLPRSAELAVILDPKPSTVNATP